MTNIVDIEINQALEAYRSECMRQGVSRSLQREDEIVREILGAADPIAALASEAGARVGGLALVRSAVLHLAGSMNTEAPASEPEQEAEAPKPKRGRKSKETADV